MRTFLTALLFFAAATAQAGETVWQHQVRLIGAKLDESIAAATAGDIARGKQLAEAAYFELFEGEPHNMEVAVRTHISGKRCYALESQFTELRQGISKGLNAAAIATAKAKLLADLADAANELDATAPASTAVSTISVA